MKRVWNIRFQDSPYSILMRCLYGVSLSMFAPIPGRVKRMRDTYATMKDFIRWEVHEGAIDFWTDTWIGDKVLKAILPVSTSPPLIQVKEFLDNGYNHIGSLFIPQNLLSQVLQTPLDDDKDLPIWTLTTSGCFTVASAYLSHFRSRPTIRATKELWNLKVPLRLSLLVWRVLHFKTPTNDNISKLGIPLVSKCSCYRDLPNQESVIHVFR
jgi:hypothetical protein